MSQFRAGIAAAIVGTSLAWAPFGCGGKVAPAPVDGPGVAAAPAEDAGPSTPPPSQPPPPPDPGVASRNDAGPGAVTWCRHDSDKGCDDILGPLPFSTLYDPDVLMRSLDPGDSNGQRFHVQRAGQIQWIEAALWTDTPQVVVANVSRYLRGVRTPITSVSSPASPLPAYKGTLSENRTTFYRVDPPIAVAAGDIIDVLFEPTETAVGGIHRRDVDLTSQITYEDPNKLIDSQDWDFVARLYVAR